MARRHPPDGFLTRGASDFRRPTRPVRAEAQQQPRGARLCQGVLRRSPDGQEGRDAHEAGRVDARGGVAGG